MNNFNFNLNNCVSISIDGCSVMTSKVCKTVKTLLNKMLCAIKCWFYNDNICL